MNKLKEVIRATSRRTVPQVKGQYCSYFLPTKHKLIEKNVADILKTLSVLLNSDKCLQLKQEQSLQFDALTGIALNFCGKAWVGTSNEEKSKTVETFIDSHLSQSKFSQEVFGPLALSCALEVQLENNPFFIGNGLKLGNLPEVLQKYPMNFDCDGILYQSLLKISRKGLASEATAFLTFQEKSMKKRAIDYVNLRSFFELDYPESYTAELTESFLLHFLIATYFTDARSDPNVEVLHKNYDETSLGIVASVVGLAASGRYMELNDLMQEMFNEENVESKVVAGLDATIASLLTNRESDARHLLENVFEIINALPAHSYNHMKHVYDSFITYCLVNGFEQFALSLYKVVKLSVHDKALMFYKTPTAIAALNISDINYYYFANLFNNPAQEAPKSWLGRRPSTLNSKLNYPWRFEKEKANVSYELD